MSTRTKNTAFAAGLVVKSRDGTQEGKLTGTSKMCQLEGCRGLRLGVRWADGRLTWPCTKGMTYDETTKTWKIE